MRQQRSQRKAQPPRQSPLTGLADLAQMILPFTPLAPAAPFVPAVRNVLGFNEREVSKSVGGAAVSGGTIVRTMDAPVAFARNQIQTGMKILQSGDDVQRISVCDFWGVVTFKATSGAPTFYAFSEPLAPLNSQLLTRFYTEFEMWERWRPVLAKIHYAHFAPTATQGALAIGLTEDVVNNETSADLTNFGNATTMEHVAVGSCYEDFSLVASPSSWKPGEWLYNDDPAEATPEAQDPRWKSPGAVFFVTDNGTQTVDTTTGYLYIELIFDVCGRRPPFDGAGLVWRINRKAKHVRDDSERARFVNEAMARVTAKMIKDLRVKKPPQFDLENYLRTAVPDDDVRESKQEAIAQASSNASISPLPVSRLTKK